MSKATLYLPLLILALLPISTPSIYAEAPKIRSIDIHGNITWVNQTISTDTLTIYNDGNLTLINTTLDIGFRIIVYGNLQVLHNSVIKSGSSGYYITVYSHADILFIDSIIIDSGRYWGCGIYYYSDNKLVFKNTTIYNSNPGHETFLAMYSGSLLMENTSISYYRYGIYVSNTIESINISSLQISCITTQLYLRSSTTILHNININGSASLTIAYGRNNVVENAYAYRSLHLSLLYTNVYLENISSLYQGTMYITGSTARFKNLSMNDSGNINIKSNSRVEIVDSIIKFSENSYMNIEESRINVYKTLIKASSTNNPVVILKYSDRTIINHTIIHGINSMIILIKSIRATIINSIIEDGIEIVGEGDLNDNELYYYHSIYNISLRDGVLYYGRDIKNVVIDNDQVKEVVLVNAYNITIRDLTLKYALKAITLYNVSNLKIQKTKILIKRNYSIYGTLYSNIYGYNISDISIDYVYTDLESTSTRWKTGFTLYYSTNITITNTVLNGDKYDSIIYSKEINNIYINNFSIYAKEFYYGIYLYNNAWRPPTYNSSIKLNRLTITSSSGIRGLYIVNHYSVNINNLYINTSSILYNVNIGGTFEDYGETFIRNTIIYGGYRGIYITRFAHVTLENITIFLTHYPQYGIMTVSIKYLEAENITITSDGTGDIGLRTYYVGGFYNGSATIRNMVERGYRAGIIIQSTPGIVLENIELDHGLSFLYNKYLGVEQYIIYPKNITIHNVPVLYIYNKNNVSIANNTEIIVVNSTNIKIENISTSNLTHTLYTAYSNVTLSNSNITKIVREAVYAVQANLSILHTTIDTLADGSVYSGLSAIYSSIYMKNTSIVDTRGLGFTYCNRVILDNINLTRISSQRESQLSIYYTSFVEINNSVIERTYINIRADSVIIDDITVNLSSVNLYIKTGFIKDLDIRGTLTLRSDNYTQIIDSKIYSETITRLIGTVHLRGSVIHCTSTRPIYYPTLEVSGLFCMYNSTVITCGYGIYVSSGYSFINRSHIIEGLLANLYIIKVNNNGKVYILNTDIKGSKGIDAYSGEIYILNTTINSSRYSYTYGIRTFSRTSRVRIGNSLITNANTGIYHYVGSLRGRYLNITKNTLGVYKAESYARMTIHNSSIYSNNKCGVRGFGETDIRYNYWGSSNGPEYTSSCDQYDPEEIYGTYLLYTPYLVEPPIRDNTSPVISLSILASAQTVVSGTFTVEYNASDNEELLTTVILIDNFVVFIGNGSGRGRVDIDSTLYSDGEHLLRIIAFDYAGNYVEHRKKIIIDNTKPKILSINPGNNTIISGVINITPYIKDLSTDSTYMYIDGTLYSIVNGSNPTFILDSTHYTDGIHNISVTTYDKQGRSDTAYVFYKIDNTPPNGSIIYPYNSSLVNSSIAVNVSVYDINLDHYNLYIDNSSITSWDVNGYHSIMVNTNTLADGWHILRLSVIDLAGNKLCRTIRFEIDNTAPFIYVDSIQGNNSDDNISISFFITEARPDTIEIYVDGRLIETIKYSSNVNYTILLNNLSQGQHILVLKANDSLGHIYTKTLKVVKTSTTIPAPEPVFIAVILLVFMIITVMYRVSRRAPG